MLMTTRVERVGTGIETARALAIKADAQTVSTRAEERNIRAPLLKKTTLSRGNWRWRAGSAETEFRRPRQHRREGNIKKPALEHEQEGYRQELPVGHRE